MHLIRTLSPASACKTAGNFGAGGGRQIDIVHGNVLDTDIDDATAVFVYLVPAGVKLLKQALVSRLQRGARVVTYGAYCVVIRTLVGWNLDYVWLRGCCKAFGYLLVGSNACCYLLHTTTNQLPTHEE